MKSYWRVAVSAPLDAALTYSTRLPVGLAPGVRVKVPLGRRFVEGVVLSQELTAPDFETKDISEILDEWPPLPRASLQWLEWLASYYLHPIGQVLDLAFPPLSRKNRRGQPKILISERVATPPPTLTEEQSHCLSEILKSRDFATHLLFGVTGSGKTEVYLRIIEETLKKDLQTIVIVPEISLTPQLTDRFASRFGDLVAVIHSHLTDRERTDQWWDVIEGRKKILVGARSALFCPAQKIGAVIVDEEHEPSFKQEEKLKYQARDAAILLGRFHNCPVILGSATPSLESWQNAADGKYRLHVMSRRARNVNLPDITVVDLREEKTKETSQNKPADLPFWISPLLYQKATERLLQNQQVAFFLNRRGIAKMVVCPFCGGTTMCPNCSVSLTLHGKSHLVCHYCDYSEGLKTRCGECRQGEPKPIGLGTERIEEDLRVLFPGRNIARADRDEIQSRADIEDLIRSVENEEVQILVGTQMIAKGLDFPKMTLVGVVLADTGFNLPDFRASERSFQLLTQMAGRSGRHQWPGEVVIQTFNPDHPSVHYTCSHDYRAFAELELRSRRELLYPPFGRLACFRIQSSHSDKAHHAAQSLLDRIQTLKKLSPQFAGLECLGPAEAPLSRLKGKFRLQLITKSPSPTLLNTFCRKILSDGEWIPSSVKISVDMDPVHML